MRIAVIGAGVSGLVAADGLCGEHDVTLFEAQDRLGGHVHTVDVEYADERHVIDTGFIVHNDRNYPRFVALLRSLGTRTRPTSMSFSVRCDRTGLEYNGGSLNGLFAQRANVLRPRFWRMTRDIVRFNREANSLMNDPSRFGLRSESRTVGEFLRRSKYSAEFVEYYLAPMGSAIWSIPTGKFYDFPIRFLIEFFRQHGLLASRNRPVWRVIEGGAREYTRALIGRFRGTVRLSTPIQFARREADRVRVTPRGDSPMDFDHVVFACHSDQALAMLADPTPLEREVLGAFPYERNEALLHVDESVLPRNRRAWASWNFLWTGSPERKATVTYCMNILQHIHSRHTFNVSLNLADRIDSRKILRTLVYEHPVFTTRRDAARARRHEMTNANRTSFCGAYWGNGFHEDGVTSALEVRDALSSARDRTAAPLEEFEDEHPLRQIAIAARELDATESSGAGGAPAPGARVSTRARLPS